MYIEAVDSYSCVFLLLFLTLKFFVPFNLILLFFYIYILRENQKFRDFVKQENSCSYVFSLLNLTLNLFLSLLK